MYFAFAREYSFPAMLSASITWIQCKLLSCLQAAGVPTEQQEAAQHRACRPAAAAAVQAHEAGAGAAVPRAQGTCQPWHGLGARHQLPGVPALLLALAALQVGDTVCSCLDFVHSIVTVQMFALRRTA